MTATPEISHQEWSRFGRWKATAGLFFFSGLGLSIYAFAARPGVIDDSKLAFGVLAMILGLIIRGLSAAVSGRAKEIDLVIEEMRSGRRDLAWMVGPEASAPFRELRYRYKAQVAKGALVLVPLLALGIPLIEGDTSVLGTLDWWGFTGALGVGAWLILWALAFWERQKTSDVLEVLISDKMIYCTGRYLNLDGWRVAEVEMSSQTPPVLRIEAHQRQLHVKETNEIFIPLTGAQAAQAPQLIESLQSEDSKLGALVEFFGNFI